MIPSLYALVSIRQPTAYFKGVVSDLASGNGFFALADPFEYAPLNAKHEKQHGIILALLRLHHRTRLDLEQNTSTTLRRLELKLVCCSKVLVVDLANWQLMT